MEITITLIIAIIGCILSVITFAINRKDKSNKDIREEQKEFDKRGIIEYRLNSIDKQLEKILNKLDFYDKEIDERIDLAIKQHIEIYHK